jgi:hypothetical protein
MDLTLAVLCDYANVSADGKLNILGIFTEINAGAFPAMTGTFYLVTSFSAGPAESGQQKVISIAFLDADGHDLGRFESQITIPLPARPGSQAIVNQIARLDGVAFPKLGGYSFAVLVGGEQKGSVEVHVNPPQGGGYVR